MKELVPRGSGRPHFGQAEILSGILLPPQGFGPEAKTRGGIIVVRAYIDYLTIRPVARKGYGSIAHEAKPNGLLTPWPLRAKGLIVLVSPN